jgi:DNA repair exonuclease SbcCD ATPase subunit
MTFEELLKANGVADEAIAKIGAGMKENKFFLASEENLDVRYGKVKSDLEAVTNQNAEAQKLIEQLKKDGETGAKAQGKIAEYEKQLAEVKAQLEQTQIEAELKDALRDANAKADDMDYLLFRIRQNNAEIKRGDDGKIKGLSDMVAAVKTAHPSQFNAADGKKVDVNKLPEGQPDGKNEPQTLAEALQAAYESEN